jgi:hypothetical protein
VRLNNANLWKSTKSAAVFCGLNLERMADKNMPEKALSYKGSPYTEPEV